MQAIRYFSDPGVCVEFVAALRWPDGVVCPHCESKNVGFLRSRRIWKCRGCRKQFSVKTGTIFEDSPIPLDKWLTAVWMVVNCKNGISSYELARDLKVTQKSAWFMLHRIRLALKNGSWEKMGGGDSGPVEIDETFVGGTPRFMHKGRRLALIQKRNEVADWKAADTHPGKTVVMGMLDRESRQIRAKIVPNVKRETLQNEILSQVERGSTVYTDAATPYYNLAAREYIHETVTHVDEYVRGQVSHPRNRKLLEPTQARLKGTYVAVEPFQLERYVDEQVFRFNNRFTRDNPDRFMLAVSQIAGKRLTYAELTGKVGETEPF